MAWEHSYSHKAYDDAWEELNLWSVKDLAKAYAAFTESNDDTPFVSEAILETYAKDTLVDLCMEAIRITNLCDNGGWAMWIDEEGFWKVQLSQGDKT